MDAKFQLLTAAKAFDKFHFDPVIIGNAGAVLNGAPLTTLDIDYLIENSPENYRKIMAIASFLHCNVYEIKIPEPNTHYVYRLINAEQMLAFDILYQISGFEDISSIRQNAHVMRIDGYEIKVADLQDIIKSKRAAGREKDLAVLPLLEKTQKERLQMIKNGQKG